LWNIWIAFLDGGRNVNIQNDSIFKIELKNNSFLGETYNLHTDEIGHVPTKTSSQCQSLRECMDNDCLLETCIYVRPITKFIFHQSKYILKKRWGDPVSSHFKIPVIGNEQECFSQIQGGINPEI